jgi:hypothetical protein
MKKFVFALDRIRAWNSTKLQVEEAALENLLGQLRIAETAYALTCTQRSDFERQTLRQPTIESTELARIGQFRQFAAAEKRRFEAARVEFNTQIAARRLRIVEIKRKIQLFDKLKQRQQASWTAEETKELQTAADEAFSQKIVAKRI